MSVGLNKNLQVLVLSSGPKRASSELVHQDPSSLACVSVLEVGWTFLFNLSFRLDGKVRCSFATTTDRTLSCMVETAAFTALESTKV